MTLLQSGVLGVIIVTSVSMCWLCTGLWWCVGIVLWAQVNFMPTYSDMTPERGL